MFLAFGGGLLRGAGAREPGRCLVRTSTLLTGLYLKDNDAWSISRP